MYRNKTKTPIFSLSKIAASVTLASTFFVASPANPSALLIAAPTLPVGESRLSPEDHVPEILAQGVDTIILFRTAGYTVRLFDGGNRMNVYDISNDIVRLDGGATTYTVLNGFPTYISTGSYSGQAATYRVFVEGENRLRLQIETGSGIAIADQFSTSVTTFVPDTTLVEAQGATILFFQTDTYAARVFERQDESLRNRFFMNVYERLSGDARVNGAAANLVEPLPPYDRAVSYVSSGEISGRPVQYFARVLNTGQAILEIYNVNNQLIAQEFATGPVTVNIPANNLPPGIDAIETATNAYIAAVFGGNSTLNEVKRLYPDAVMVSARQGGFINAGDFSDRNGAEARVLQLRSLGFEARVIFRDVLYR